MRMVRRSSISLQLLQRKQMDKRVKKVPAFTRRAIKQQLCESFNASNKQGVFWNVKIEPSCLEEVPYRIDFSVEHAFRLCHLYSRDLPKPTWSRYIPLYHKIPNINCQNKAFLQTSFCLKVILARSVQFIALMSISKRISVIKEGISFH